MLETSPTNNGIANSHLAPPNDDTGQKTDRRLMYYAHHPQFISHRISQLDKETSVEQLIENGATSLSVAGIILALLSNRRWLILSLLATGILFMKRQSDTIGLLELLRERGYRTQDEIAHEKQVLQALRGDFDAIGQANQTPEERVRQIVDALEVRK